MTDVLIRGDLSCEEIAEALKKAFPDRSFRINMNGAASGRVVDVVSSADHNTSQLLKTIAEREREVRASEEAAKKALLTIQTLNKQQQDLFDEFVLLRQRYDEQKASTVNILWNHCAKYHPDLRQIPTMQDASTFVENDERVGNVIVGDFLGEGQFATVKNCALEGKDHEYALKIIKKDRITSFTSLMRVSNEIDNLKLLKSPYIVTVEQVLHTQDMLYIITEKGGRDLFEFFDEHPEGVKESWAREIITCVLKGVLYCHEQGICHRDLKPENILVSFDQEEERCLDLKLCDFGLSTKFKPKQLLTDFCGSPGFFCPEMIIHGSYFGDKADVWSVGCILLELVLGHERFCELWMTAYDYEILQDKALFTKTIEETVGALPDHLEFSEDLNDFILRFIELRSSRRPHIKSIATHGWLLGRLLEDIVGGGRGSKISLDSANNSPANRPWSPPSLSPSPSFNGSTNIVTHESIASAYENVSGRERKVLEEFFNNHGDGDHVMHLPPITPATPNIGAAKKILRKGNELANNAVQLSFDHHHSQHAQHLSSQHFHSHHHSHSNNNSENHSPMMMGKPMQARSRLPSLIEHEDLDAKAVIDERASSAPSVTALEKPALYASNSEGILSTSPK